MRVWQVVVLTVSCCSHRTVNVEEFIPQPITQTIAQPIAQRHEKYASKLQENRDETAPYTAEEFSVLSTDTIIYSAASSAHEKIDIHKGCGNSSNELAQTGIVVWKKIPPCKNNSFGVLYFQKETVAVTDSPCVLKLANVIVCSRVNVVGQEDWMKVALEISSRLPEAVVNCVLKMCFSENGTMSVTVNGQGPETITVQDSESRTDPSHNQIYLNTSLTISDLQLGMLKSVYQSMLDERTTDENLFLMVIVLITIFYGIFGVIAGYESVALLLREMKKS